MTIFFFTYVDFTPRSFVLFQQALSRASRFNNRKLSMRLAFDLSSKACPWKYLRAEAVVPARSILREGESIRRQKRQEEFYRVRTV